MSQEQWKVSKEEFISPTTTIPTITFQDIPPPLPTLRSQSFDLPRGKQQGVHAHFDKAAAMVRPGMAKSSISHSEGYSLRRPSVASRKSFSRSVSSFSLYSHFAGERFSHNKRKDSRKLFMETSDLKKCKHFKESTSTVDDNSAKSFDSENGEPPKASVGKAMVMFLKAFIGSGVLFLPKA